MLPAPVLDLLSAQYGLISRPQVRRLLDTHGRRMLYRSCEFELMSCRVLRHRATPLSLGTQLHAAVLDAMPDASLWGASAAFWWGFGRERDPHVRVARPVRTVEHPLGRIHRLIERDPVDFTEHRGIPIARPERVILSLADHETRRLKPSRYRSRRPRELTDEQILAPAITKIGFVLDHAWRLKLIDGEFIHELCDRYAGQGNSGVVVLRALLLDRPPDYVPPGSGLERRFEELVGPVIEQFERQIEVSDEHGLIGRVDYKAIRHPIVVEINSETFHTTHTDRERDARRYERLVESGYAVVVFWEYDIWHGGPIVRKALDRLLGVERLRPGVYRPTPAPWELLPPV